MPKISRLTVALIFGTWTFSLHAEEPKCKAALVVIDMQPYFWEKKIPQDESNRDKIKQALQSQRAAIEEALRTQQPIVFLEYESCGETTAELKTLVEGKKDVAFFQKDEDGMLDEKSASTQALLEYFRAKSINTLVVTGANGGFCVLQSIRQALDKNFSVLAYSQGIIDFNPKKFIYPYRGRYWNLQGRAPYCVFREVDNLKDIKSLFEAATAEKKGETPAAKAPAELPTASEHSVSQP